MVACSSPGVASTHLLSNPIYIGRICHKGTVHDGQYPPIIDTEMWGAVQERLADNTARAKRRETAASPSPLAGKFTDETGDRLTPSHALRRGLRHRYYVSHRLIARSGETDLDGWRLPAAKLEGAVLALIRNLLADTARPTSLLIDRTAAEVANLRDRARAMIDAIDSASSPKLLAALVEAGCVAPGKLSVSLDRSIVAKQLKLPADRVDPASLTLQAGFTLRRRGAEAKLVFDDAAPEIDRTLLRNLARGWDWFEEIKQGASMQEIARRETLSQRRIARLVDFAFLAPDIVEAIVTGRQSVTLTSDALIKSDHQPLWAEQRATIAAL